MWQYIKGLMDHFETLAVFYETMGTEHANRIINHTTGSPELLPSVVTRRLGKSTGWFGFSVYVSRVYWYKNQVAFENKWVRVMALDWVRVIISSNILRLPTLK